MEGNILSSKQRAIYNFLYKPFKIVCYAFIVLFLVVNPLPFLAQFNKYINDFIIKGFNEFNITTTETQTFLITFIIPISLFLINIILPHPIKQIRKRITVGTKIEIYASNSYRKYNKTGTSTSYYYGGVHMGTYKNLNTQQCHEKLKMIAVVTLVNRKNFEIEFSGNKRLIKFNSLYSWENIEIGPDTYQIYKMDIIT